MAHGRCPCPPCRSKHDVRCVRQLLQQGADPAAGDYRSALWVLSRIAEGPCLRLLPAFMEQGFDPLVPVRPDWPRPGSLLTTCPVAAPLLLAHLEQQRAAGSLQLGSVQRAAQLVAGVALTEEAERHLPLARHGIAALEQLLGLAGGGDSNAGGGGITAADARVLQSLLMDVVASGQPAVLEPLLSSRLPLDLATEPGCPSLLSTAAIGSHAAACVRLLRQAGAPAPTPSDIYCAIDRLAADGLAALLACGAPAIDVSEPAVRTANQESWSCPIHRAVFAAAAVRLPARGVLREWVRAA